MPRSPSPDRHRSHATTSRRTDDRPSERRRSRSPARRDREGDERRSSRRDEDERGDRRDDKRRERSRSRDRGERSSRRERDDRERSRSRERGHRSSRRRDPSTSGSDSDDSRERRHRSSRRRSRSRSRSRSRDRGDKDEKRRRREEKKERKAKREQKKLAKKGVKVVEWGKHGILTEADIYTKNDEFHAWMIGEKTENPGTTTKAKEKELFKVFMEDFNTGTLPHEKYYDIAKYEKKMSAVRMGETVEEVDGGYDFNKDVEAAKSSHRRAAAPELNPLHNRAQLEALRKVQNDRIHVEKMKRLGLDVPQNMGARMEDKMSKG